MCPDFRTKASRIRKRQREAGKRKPRVRLTGDVGRSCHSSVAAFWESISKSEAESPSLETSDK